VYHQNANIFIIRYLPVSYDNMISEDGTVTVGVFHVPPGGDTWKEISRKEFFISFITHFVGK